MSQPAFTNKDYIRESSNAIGSWFLAYKKLKQDTLIQFIIKKKSATNISSFDFDHSLHDGMSCLSHLSQKENFEISQIKKDSDSQQFKFFDHSFYLYFKQTLLFLYYARKRKFNIWGVKYSYQFKNETHEANQKKQIFNITTTELNEVIHFCKSNNVNLNAYLLYCLNQTIKNHFNITQETNWWMPVNFRSEFKLFQNISLDSEQLNCVSNFTITIKNQDSVQAVYQNIKASLKNKLHWGVWAWQRLALYLSENMIVSLCKDQLRNNFYVGTFTNLGQWQSKTEFDEFYFFVNTLPSHPIGASAIQINDTLYLGLKFHSCLLMTIDETLAISQKWKNTILRK